MGVGCQFGCCGFVALLGIVAVIVGLVLARRGRSKIGRIAGGCGLLVVIFSVAWVALSMLAMRGFQSTNRAVFEEAFGFPAPDAVTEIRSFRASSTDWFRICMTFTADPEAIRHAIDAAAYVPDPSPDHLSCERDLAWWNPTENMSTWSREPFYESSSGWSKATLACPEEGGQCFLVARGAE